VIPVELFDVLYGLSLDIQERLKGTKINSFDILHRKMNANAYREWLTTERGDANLDGLEVETVI
jgi:hypothetical protein